MFVKVLSAIYYIIWIIIGFAIIGGIIFMILVNPFAKVEQMMQEGANPLFQMMDRLNSQLDVKSLNSGELGKEAEACIEKSIGLERMNAIRSGGPYTPDEVAKIGQCLQK